MMHWKGLTLMITMVVALLLPVGGEAQMAERVAVESVRTHEPVVLDGRLDEPAWRAAPSAEGFVQSWPEFGAPPSQRTEARLLFDDDYAYIGLRMYDDAPDSISAPLARRGAELEDSDWVHVVLDSRMDRRTGFRFSVNPRGVQRDAYHFNDTEEDNAWEAVWEVETEIDDEGWTAEFRIPLSQLRFGGEAGETRTWGLQILRDIARTGERAAWAPWDPAGAGFVSRFGFLEGLENVAAPRGTELIPYVSGSLSRAVTDPGDPFARATMSEASVGADLRIGLPRGLTLAATLNPDFGQVEADPAEVNLTAFESFFDEQRPFFTEGADMFRFGESRAFSRYGLEHFFYSRRVGQPPPRQLGPPEHLHVDAPEQTRILGAGKLSGRSPGGWSIGVMNAVTARERARFADPDGAVGAATVAPLTNHLVARLRRDVRDGEGGVGGIVTATRRDLDEDTAPLLHRSGYLAGADFIHTWADRRWSLSGLFAASRVTGKSSALLLTQRQPARYFQQPDAHHVELDPLRTSLQGHLIDVSLARTGTWMGSVQLKQASPGFEINDLGFQGRSDSRSIVTLAGRQGERFWGFRQHSFYVTSFHAWNLGGDRILDGYRGAAEGTLPNLWSMGFGLGYRPEHRDDRLTRGGPVASHSSFDEAWGWLQSDPRRSVSARLSARQNSNEAGMRERELDARIEFRPSPPLRLELAPQVIRMRNPAQYVATVPDPAATETFGARYVFASMDQTTVSIEARADWTLLRTLSLQLYVQPFASAVEFRNFAEFARPGTLEFARYGVDRGTLCLYGAVYAVAPVSEIGCPEDLPPEGHSGFTVRFVDPSFTLRSLRGTALLRWEFLPGSTLYLVWQQEREGTGAAGVFQFRGDMGAVFREPARNVFMVKASYWIGK